MSIPRLSTILVVLLSAFWMAAVSVCSSTLLLARSHSQLCGPRKARHAAAVSLGRHRPQQRRRLYPVQCMRWLRAQVVTVSIQAQHGLLPHGGASHAPRRLGRSGERLRPPAAVRLPRPLHARQQRVLLHHAHERRLLAGRRLHSPRPSRRRQALPLPVHAHNVFVVMCVRVKERRRKKTWSRRTRGNFLPSQL